MLKAKDKTKIISKFGTQHLQKHKKDNSSRVGLLKMVGKRRRLLEFLKKDAPKRYAGVIKQLDLKR